MEILNEKADTHAREIYVLYRRLEPEIPPGNLRQNTLKTRSTSSSQSASLIKQKKGKKGGCCPNREENIQENRQSMQKAHNEDNHEIMLSTSPLLAMKVSPAP